MVEPHSLRGTFPLNLLSEAWIASVYRLKGRGAFAANAKTLVHQPRLLAKAGREWSKARATGEICKQRLETQINN